ncbi:hypothetical protein SAMN06298216_2340 [Spirosomataceae bacterium TFI 002]|nr:hypothetical protein SAMN06298216_2340 [Spirosomataceae bacterium TFI 002]
MKKSICFVLIFLFFALNSCDIRRVFDDGSHKLGVNNNTSSTIKIESFKDGKSIGSFDISSKSTYKRLFPTRDNIKSIINGDRADSVVVSRENDGKYFQYYCDGESLYPARCLSNETLPNLAFSQNCTIVDKFEKGDRIIEECFYDINETDFNP